jgi:hypothetical protein
MTPEQFKDWREAMGFRSRAAAAEALGLAPGTIVQYEEGVRRDNGNEVEIPQTVEMACRLLESKRMIETDLTLWLALGAALTEHQRRMLAEAMDNAKDGLFRLAWQSISFAGMPQVLVSKEADYAFTAEECSLEKLQDRLDALKASPVQLAPVFTRPKARGAGLITSKEKMVREWQARRATLVQELALNEAGKMKFTIETPHGARRRSIERIKLDIADIDENLRMAAVTEP